MLKSRILLGMVFLGVMAGLAILWSTSLQDGLKVLVTVIGGYLSTSALLFFISTYFMLDSEGRIIHGSLLYKYFRSWYTKEEKNEEGMVKIVRMPEKVRICPSYWMIVAGLFIGSLVVFYISAFAFGLFSVGYKVLTAGVSVDPRVVIDIASVLGWITLFSAVVVGGAYLSHRLKNGWLRGLAVTFVIAAALAVVMGAVVHINSFANEISMAASLDQTVSRIAAVRDIDTQHLKESAAGFGKFMGIVLSVAGGLALLIWGAVVLAGKLFPWLKETLIWKVLSAVYDKFCPEFLIAPAPQEEK